MSEEIYLFEMKVYFELFQCEIDRVYVIVRKVCVQGKDLSFDVEVLQVIDMVGCVESFVGLFGVVERIRELVKEYGKEIVVFKVVDEIIEGKFGDFGSKEKYVEQVVRIVLVILMEGIVFVLLEGIVDVKIKCNEWVDGSEYLVFYYVGLIRSFGGMVQVLSVFVGDYVRRKFGFDCFKLSDEYIERMVEEVDFYYRVVMRLQYYLEVDEVRFVMRNILIEIIGEEIDKVEVFYRNVFGVEMNYFCGGVIFVFVEGVLQKVKKFVKYIDKMGIEGWDWIKEFVEVKEKGKSSEENKDELKVEDIGIESVVEKKENVEKGFYYEFYEKFRVNIVFNKKYIKEIIGGRFFFVEFLINGGFRFRYGCLRVFGFVIWSVNLVIMFILDEFIVIGIQMKMERLGKGCIVILVIMVEGLIVRFKNGSVVRVDDYEMVLKVRNEVDEILYVGDVFVNFGDFVENNQMFFLVNYVEEWWVQELVQVIKDFYEVEFQFFVENDREVVEEVVEYFEVDFDFLWNFLKDLFRVKLDVEMVIYFLMVFDILFYLYYIFYWNIFQLEEVEEFQKVFLGVQIEWVEFRKNCFVKKVVFENDKNIKCYFEFFGLFYRFERVEKKRKVIVVEYFWSVVFLMLFGNFEWEFKVKFFYMVIDIINENNRIKFCDRGISWIGVRMGRLEKVKERKMKLLVQVFFFDRFCWWLEQGY